MFVIVFVASLYDGHFVPLSITECLHVAPISIVGPPVSRQVIADLLIMNWLVCASEKWRITEDSLTVQTLLILRDKVVERNRRSQESDNWVEARYLHIFNLICKSTKGLSSNCLRY